MTGNAFRGTALARGILVAVGVAVLGYGGYGVVADRLFADLAYPRFLLLSLLVPVLLAVPVALLVGAGIVRWVPASARPALQATLFISAVVLVVAVPLLVTGPGRPGSSVLPRDYPLGLVVVVASVWGVLVVAAAIHIVFRIMRNRKEGRRS